MPFRLLAWGLLCLINFREHRQANTPTVSDGCSRQSVSRQNFIRIQAVFLVCLQRPGGGTSNEPYYTLLKVRAASIALVTLSELGITCAHSAPLRPELCRPLAAIARPGAASDRQAALLR